ncbi:tetratricopeptide repeat (TPR)-like superfamily protein [Artemisia annua]|uniref:Tetratricopeptide repeat (TPR)-like superfamily protein n=1 Tax=Artemisia annua TaxID=35608 RepID=A0A2U1QEQ4_ARTAN|nr:tetratricopeptide repeat (TPR)-like superfamily protein [Artemisia annua]
MYLSHVHQQVDNGNDEDGTQAADAHLLQLRFLTLKNLATVFLQQGPPHYQSALQCYLQAVDIDSKDSVVWNQLGTLACSMALFTISRWAFEQGLICSPNNWNCMEKLLEVLIAIGDEVACLSVAELILRHWPSHARALHVKRVIEDSEPTPFAPRGIDKLEPHHVRLKFMDKRKATDHDLDDSNATKRLNQNIMLSLPEASWTALAGELLGILIPLNECDNTESGARESLRSGDIRLVIQLPSSSDNVAGERKTSNEMETEAVELANAETSMYEEPLQGRRSTRLRSRKPDKEESSDFTATKDLVKLVPQFLEPFVMVESGITKCSEVMTDTQNNESFDVARFVNETSNNHGAYHLGHLLLEDIACRNISFQDAFAKFLELEKLTRNSGEVRTPECSLFLAELSYDFGIRSSDPSTLTEFMSMASYHLCKVVESLALDYSFDSSGGIAENDTSPSTDGSLIGSLLDNKRAFWARFYWLSGKLAILNGNKEKAQKDFGVSLALFTAKENAIGSISLPHLKVTKELTIDSVLREINQLEVDFLMKNNVGDMTEKDLPSECISLLAPLLFSMEDDNVADSSILSKDGDGIVTSAELSALNVLIKACEKSKPVDANVYLRCHRQKLRLLMAASGVEQCFGSQKSFNVATTEALAASETESSENLSVGLHPLLSEELKAISKCALELKNSISPCGSIDSYVAPMKIISDIQSLLIAAMSHIAKICFSKKFLGVDDLDDKERRNKHCFVDAAIAFFRLQHLNPNVPLKIQVELIIAIHDMLAEYGICCASGDGEEEGTFLKLAIKHLLYLDMKLKSTSTDTQSDEQLSHEDYTKKSGDDSNEQSDTVKTITADKDATTSSKSSAKDTVKEKMAVECGQSSNEEEDVNNKFTESEIQLTEEEKEDLEIEIDTALDQCFFCLYGLHLRSDSSYEDDLVTHKNTSRGDYQTKEQCADVFQYILPYAKASSKTGLVKLRRVLRAIRKHFPQPPDNVLDGNAIEKFLDDPGLCEDKLSEEAGSDGFRDSILNFIYQDGSVLKEQLTAIERSEPYMDVYRNLYYLLAQSEEISATDKWAGFVLTKEGEDFVQQTAKLFKYDLLFNPLRFESWQRLATIYDEEVDLLLNDGSKQINVTGWRKNASYSQRVDTSRRRSRRCLLMTLALANTADQQGEIHELLALVYYDGLQNVVPIYDQRFNLPVKDAEWKMFCQNSMKHFEKAFAHKEDWSYVYYLGKLSEKLSYSRETSFAYYDKAIALNPSAVDPFYRLHASRLKLLWSCGQNDKEALKIAAMYSFNQSTKEAVMNVLDKANDEKSSSMDVENLSQSQHDLADMWHKLYDDCLSALQICVEGDLKHFHKARYMLAQGLYHRKGDSGNLDKAKDELSFCFKSSRSSYTINMWEIDSTVKKGRRKTPSLAGNRKTLEVNLAESSRKFITCIRKYILFYMKLLEETRDISTLERAYTAMRADKRFSLCLEDLVPIALGRYIKALVSSINQIEIGTSSDNIIALEHLLEKLFALYMEQMNMWSDICTLPEIKCPDLSESSLFGYLFKYIQILETNCRLEALEGINEKMRKRLKNPKLSNSNCAKVHKHVSMAWCRCLVISMATVTPLNTRFTSESQDSSLLDGGSVNNQQLCIDLRTDEFWQSSFEDANHLKFMETKWNSLLSKMKDVVIKRPSEENMEVTTMLLKSSFNFYKDSSCAVPPSCLNLYVMPSQLSTEGYIQPNVDPFEPNTAKKLLVWAYTLLHGRCITNMPVIIKYCEETAKSKMKKGGGGSLPSTPPTPTMLHSVVACQTGVGKDVVGISSGKETTAMNVESTNLTETKSSENLSSKPDIYEGPASLKEPEPVTPANEDHVDENSKMLSAAPPLIDSNNGDTTTSHPDEPQAAAAADCTKT